MTWRPTAISKSATSAWPGCEMGGFGLLAGSFCCSDDYWLDGWMLVCNILFVCLFVCLFACFICLFGWLVGCLCVCYIVCVFEMVGLVAWAKRWLVTWFDWRFEPDCC